MKSTLRGLDLNLSLKLVACGELTETKSLERNAIYPVTFFLLVFI